VQRGQGLKKSVFLSYARSDRERVGPLANALEASGFQVWWDSMLVGGAAFSREIEQAIERADAVVVLWSKSSIASDWVRDEAGQARDTGKLIPALLDDCLPPLGFRQYHAVNLVRWAGDRADPGFAALSDAIGNPGRSPVHAPAHVRSAVSRRAAMIGGGAFAVAAAAGGVAWQTGLFSPKIEGNSVAVLPFANISGDAQQSYFSAGLSEEVRATLSRDARLRVMAPASIAHFADDGLTPVQLAARLGVASILSGSVRRGNGIVRVVANLVEGKKGFTIWSQSFDHSLDDVLAIESQIASTVANALAERVGTKEAPVHRANGSANTAAYDAYLRGRDLYSRITDEAGAEAALKQFDVAIAADPRFAAAYAARARTLYVLGSQFGAPSTLRTTYREALAAADRAAMLAPDLPDAQSTLGYILFQGLLRIAEARDHFQRSRAVGGGDATILARFAIYAAATGDAAGARDAMDRALVIDPFNPMIHRVAGYVAYARRDYPSAIDALQQALALNSNLLDAHAWTGDAKFALRDLAGARASYRAEPHELLRLTGLAIVEHAEGNRDVARQHLATLVSRFGDSSTYQQAQVLAQSGDVGGALARLEHAASVPDVGLMYARADPFLDPLRKEPRFRHLLNALGFV